MAGCTLSTRRARKPLEDGPRPDLQDELNQRMTYCPAFTRIGATHHFIEGVNQRMMGRSLLRSSNTPGTSAAGLIQYALRRLSGPQRVHGCVSAGSPSAQ